MIFPFQFAFSLSPSEGNKLGFYYEFEVSENNLSTHYYQKYINEFRVYLRSNKVRYLGVKTNKNGLNIAFKTSEKREEGSFLLKRKYRESFIFFDSKDGEKYILQAKLTSLAIKQAMELSLSNIQEVLKKRTDKLGIKNKEIKTKKPNHIEVKLYGIKDFDTTRKIISSIVKVELHLIKQGKKSPRDIELQNKNGIPIQISRPVILSSESITNTVPIYYQGLPALKISYGEKGSNILSDIKNRYKDKSIAVVLIETENNAKNLATGNMVMKEKNKKTIISTIRVNNISTNSITLESFDSFKEAHELSVLLNSGSVISPYYLISEMLINSAGELY